MIKEDYYNIKLNVLNTSELLSIFQSDLLKNSNNTFVYFINAHCFNIAQKNSTYLNAINDTDILLNDGIGIKLGSYLTRIKLKENMNGTDIIPKILEFSMSNNLNVYLLGGTEGIAIKAKQKIENNITGISIVGARNGYFDFHNDDSIIKDIIDSETDVLLVGMGVPRQELWLNKNKNNLNNLKICIAGGAILDFLSESVPRAPYWMRKNGIEWVFRLYQEPKRLFKRYFIGIPVFFFRILQLIIKKKK